MSDIHELLQQALEIRRRYYDLNRKNGHDHWGPKDYTMGLIGDMGDLAKIVMAKENMRPMEDVDAKLEHELADCLWSLLVIADHYDINLTDAFHKNMKVLEERIQKAFQ